MYRDVDRRRSGRQREREDSSGASCADASVVDVIGDRGAEIDVI